MNVNFIEKNSEAPMSLKDIKLISHLGIGSFGCVNLIKYRGKPYALKSILKDLNEREYEKEHSVSKKVSEYEKVLIFMDRIYLKISYK